MNTNGIRLIRQAINCQTAVQQLALSACLVLISEHCLAITVTFGRRGSVDPVTIGPVW